MSKSMVLKPRLSEKAYAQSEADRTYVFDIPARANRYQIIAAVGAQYGVTVESARIAKTAPKNRRVYRKAGRRYISSQTSATRKAYVTLKEGEKLPVFAAVEEAQKTEEKAEKAAAKEKK